MAPPIIKEDEATLVEIAIVMLQNPQMKFSVASKVGFQKSPTVCHSWDSTRHRLQDKFNKDKEWWLEQGRNEIAHRRSVVLQRGLENFQEATVRIAKSMEPLVGVSLRLAEQMAPVVKNLESVIHNAEIGKAMRAMQKIESANRIYRL